MSESSDVTCAELADVAAELALGVLTGRERAAALAHLDTCDACREDVRQLMATGGQLLELLPPVEPPAGFETRVLARLGLPASAQEPGKLHAGRQPRLAPPRRGAGAVNSTRRRRPAHGEALPGGDRLGGRHPGSGRARGETRRPGRLRRMLAAVAIGLAVVVAGLGGWRLGAGAAPSASTAPGALTSVALLSTARQSVGTIYLYSGPPRWLYMSVDVETGSGEVTCQLIGADGKVHTLGTLRLTDGYGDWGSPDPGNIGNVRGARLVSATGTVLATATFTHW
jgi:hypothetical protein